MNEKAVIIGLTGPTGAGKGEVCTLLAHNDAIAVLDCDLVARWVVEKGEPCLQELVREFSDSILQPDGSLNRRTLGSIVFSDEQRLQRLNEIIFPYIRERIDREIEILQQTGKREIILDAPTLFESGADRRCDRIVAVTASDAVRRKRIMCRDGITAEQAQNRMDSQFPNEYYEQRAGYVIRNDGDRDSLRHQVAGLELWLGV